MGVGGDSAAGDGGDEEGEGEAGGIDENVRCVPVQAGGRKGVEGEGGGRRGRGEEGEGIAKE